MLRISLAILLTIVTYSPLALGADELRGEQLYLNHCTGCHNSIAHLREGRKADTVAAIRDWVIRWSRHLKLGWGELETNDVVLYLDQRYYRLSNSTVQ